MRVPRWYKVIALLWLLIVAPFWWFAAEFNGSSFFSMPTLAGPSDGAGWQTALVVQLVVISAFLVPPLLLPIALLNARRPIRDSNAHD